MESLGVSARAAVSGTDPSNKRLYGDREKLRSPCLGQFLSGKEAFKSLQHSGL
jgi:hypothetical protein